MPRIRTVKPEFWQDEKLAVLEPITRLVFLALISMADDAGRLVDNLKLIDGFVFPETADTAEASLDVLARSSRICRYTSASGQKLIQIRNWERHQKVDHPNKYVLPAPTAEDLAPPPTPLSRRSGEHVARTSRDVRDTTNDQRSTTNDLKTPAGAANGNHPGGWPAVWARTFGEHVGEIEPGRIGKRCGRVRTRYGPERALEMWEVYCRQRRHYRFGQFDPQHSDIKATTPEDFAATAKQWFNLTEPIGYAPA